MGLQYLYDVHKAAESAPGFDKANAVEIGDLHGEDPATVLRDILIARENLNSQRGE